MGNKIVARAEKHPQSSIGFDEVPGTVHLVDLLNTLSTKHSTQQTDIVLVPTPSDDPDDPLNWTPRRKNLAITCACLYTFFNAVAAALVYSVLVPISQVTGLSVSTLNSGTGYFFLMLGLGCLFWVPFALQFGKRPTYLISLLAAVLCAVWGPYALDNGQWIARNIVAGFFASVNEGLPELSVSDLYFTHQRGTFMALGAFFITGGNYFAPVICGFINDSLGYHYVFFIPASILGSVWIFLFLFMEETNYDRSTVGIIMTTSSDPSNTKEVSDSEKTTTTLDILPASTMIEQQALHLPKTYRQKLALKDHSRPNRMWQRFKQEIYFLSWPVVFYSGFAYGTVLIWFNVMNATASVILSAPPYNFKPSMVGLSYVACLIGTGIAALIGGPLSDHLAIRLSRHNKGVMEPEHRLWLLAIPMITIPAALILWGVGAAHQIHWFGLIFAMCTLAFSSTIGVYISLNYVADSYRDMCGDAQATAAVVRCTMSFVIGYGVTPWLNNLGLQNCFISAAFIGLLAGSSFLIMIKWGKALRIRSRHQYWTLVENQQKNGMVH